MSGFSPDFLHHIAKALEEEELDAYTFTLYSMNRDDLHFFDEESRKKVEAIFKALIEDSRRHADLLRLVVEMGAR